MVDIPKQPEAGKGDAQYIDTDPMWERACSRRRWISHKFVD